MGSEVRFVRLDGRQYAIWTSDGSDPYPREFELMSDGCWELTGVGKYQMLPALIRVIRREVEEAWNAHLANMIAQ